MKAIEDYDDKECKTLVLLLIEKSGICPLCLNRKGLPYGQCGCSIGNKNHYFRKYLPILIDECRKRQICLDIVDPMTVCMYCGNSIRESQLKEHIDRFGK